MTIVKDRDLGFKKYIQELNLIKKNPYVKVGLLEKAGKHMESNLTVAEIGIIHEFGAPKRRIPQRSFLRSTHDEQKEKWLKMSKILKKKIGEGKITTSAALDVMGQVIKTAVKNKIRTGPFAPLSPRTIAKKRSTVPLIDTAQMINSVEYEKVMNNVISSKF